jgi:hypothetical protein
MYCTWEGDVGALEATRPRPRAHVLGRRRGLRARRRYRVRVSPEPGSRDVARAMFYMVVTGKHDNCMAIAVRCIRAGLPWLLLSVLTILVIPPAATDITGKCSVNFISILIRRVICNVTVSTHLGQASAISVLL